VVQIAIIIIVMAKAQKTLTTHCFRHKNNCYSNGCVKGTKKMKQETQLSLTNRATHLEVSQGHQTWYHSIWKVWFPISVL